MHLKIFFLLFYLNEISAKSFTLVLDTTHTMQEELDTLRPHFGRMFSGLNLADVTNYILVPFKDPGLDSPSISDSPEGLLQSLHQVNVSGGHDCPENTLIGIQKGLEVSSDESYIFVFTDAYANDESKLANIQELCRTSRSQVVIFLSGGCKVKKEHSNVDVYYDVANSCSGAIFLLDPRDLVQAIKFINKLVETQWTDISIEESFLYLKDFNVTVDSSTTEIMLAIYGDSPTLQIFDENGIFTTVEKVMDTRNNLVAYLKEVRNTNLHIRITCYDLTSMVIYKRQEVFQYGFSTRLPKSLKETAIRPIPGGTNYIMIVLPENVTLISISLLKTNENKPKNLRIDENNGNVYITSAYIEPGTTFRITISGQDKANNESIQRSTKLIEPQRSIKEAPWIRPVVEIIGPRDINYGDTVTISCKVRGYPKPIISWDDGKGNSLPSEEIQLETPSVYMSYTRIESLNSNLTVSCTAKNSQGEDVKSLDLVVYRKFGFEVKQSPKDTSVEYGTEGRLYCEVEAYPEASINWYHNDTRVTSSSFSIFSNNNANIEIRPELHALVIKNMSFEDTGEYKCEIRNDFESKSFTAVVDITGLELPTTEIDKSEITIKPGDWTEIKCVVKGKPKPQMTWKFKPDNADELTTVPDGVYFDSEKLKIPTIKMEYAGLYRCEASNILGQAHRDVIVNMKYEPTIRNVVDELIVKEGDAVELTCDVDALPPATVRWELHKDDVISILDKRHTTDENNIHRFEALWKDSGNYHCIAENEVGRAEKIAKVNVLVAPYIETPSLKSITAKFGSSVRLTCNVLYGNPVPTTKWSFVALNSTTTVLSRGNSTTALDLINVTSDHEGTYVCTADNEVGSDTIRITLRVQ